MQMKVPGIACILTYEDVPGERFTMAGQTYPEFSPYDRLILDQRMRFVGDAAAIVAGETGKKPWTVPENDQGEIQSVGACPGFP